MNKTEIKRLVKETTNTAECLFGIKFPKMEIKFDLKGTTAGICKYNTYYRFNMHIADNNEGFEQTVVHEIAHQAAFLRFGRVGRGHGKEWKQTMRRLGVDPSRCHNYKEVKKARNVKRYKIICKGCGQVMFLSSIRYNKQARGQRLYSCGICGTDISLTGAKLQRNI